VKGERSVLLLSVAVAVAGLVVIGLVIGLVVLLDPVP
jgi:hypothetical protein